MRLKGLMLLALALANGAVAAQDRTRIVFGGDVMLGRGIDVQIHESGPESVWSDAVAGLLRDADLSLVNLESVIASGGTRFSPPRRYHFRASPPAAQALSHAGIDVVSLANNHAMDYGADGLAETLAVLDEYGIAHAGAGVNRDDAWRPAWLRAGKLTVAVIAAADHFTEYAATATRPGINLITVSTDSDDLQRLENEIARARTRGADLVVFSIHWGPNWREMPPPRFQKFARAVIDAGADVFHGHSAHVFQGVEVYRDRPILYATGDLLNDYLYYPERRNDLQLLFRLELVGSQPVCMTFIPVQIDRMRVSLASGQDGAWTLERLQRLSRPFKTGFVSAGDGAGIALVEGGCRSD